MRLIRQDYLEAAIKWISEDGDVEGYMATHQNNPDANELWLYFQTVIAWVKATFPVYRKKEMNGLYWGDLYNEFKGAKLDPEKLEDEIKTLMTDDDVATKKGIYAYVLTRNEKHLASARSLKRRSVRPTSARTAGVPMGPSASPLETPTASRSSTSRRWKAITSSRGPRAARRRRPTVRCSACHATGRRAASRTAAGRGREGPSAFAVALIESTLMTASNRRAYVAHKEAFPKAQRALAPQHRSTESALRAASLVAKKQTAPCP